MVVGCLEPKLKKLFQCMPASEHCQNTNPKTETKNSRKGLYRGHFELEQAKKEQHKPN